MKTAPSVKAKAAFLCAQNFPKITSLMMTVASPITIAHVPYIDISQRPGTVRGEFHCKVLQDR